MTGVLRKLYDEAISYVCGPGSSVGIATELPGWTVWDRIPVRTRFSVRPDRT